MRKLTKYVVSLISTVNLDLTKSYRLQRVVMRLIHFRFVKYPFKRVDTKLELTTHSIPLRFYFPENEDASSLILFFHGGGFVAGDNTSYDKLCVKMAKEFQKIVVFVDYRLAPEHPYPCGLEDCYEVAKAFYLDSFLKEIKKDAITLMGDSAGGNLVAAISLRARDEGLFYPERQILIYPVVYDDHSPKAKFLSIHEKGNDYLLKSKYVEDYFNLYVSKEKRKNPYVSPLLAKDFTNLPKTLIVAAELDPLVDEGWEYAKCLQQAENEVEYYQFDGCLHGFFNGNLYSKEVKQAFHYINEFLNQK